MRAKRGRRAHLRQQRELFCEEACQVFEQVQVRQLCHGAPCGRVSHVVVDVSAMQRLWRSRRSGNSRGACVVLRLLHVHNTASDHIIANCLQISLATTVRFYHN